MSFINWIGIERNLPAVNPETHHSTSLPQQNRYPELITVSPLVSIRATFPSCEPWKKKHIEFLLLLIPFFSDQLRS